MPPPRPGIVPATAPVSSRPERSFQARRSNPWRGYLWKKTVCPGPREGMKSWGSQATRRRGRLVRWPREAVVGKAVGKTRKWRQKWQRGREAASPIGRWAQPSWHFPLLDSGGPLRLQLHFQAQPGCRHRFKGDFVELVLGDSV